MALTRAPLRVGEDLFTVVTWDRGVGMEEGGTSTLTTGITQLVVTQVIVPTAARTQAKRLSFFLRNMKHALNQQRLFISVGAEIHQELVQTCCLRSFNLLIFNEGWE